MNKKLLLSFAVFATALTVNAQKRAIKTERKSPYTTVEVVQKGNLTPDFKIESKKRGSQVITDTIGYIANKRSYGSPKTAGIWITPYYGTPDTVELMTVAQSFKNTSPIKFKSLGVSLVSLNPAGATVDVKIYDDKFNELAKVTKNVAYSASSLTTYWFNLANSVDITGDFTVSIEPNDLKDSIYLNSTGVYGRNTVATASIAGTTLTTTAFTLGSSFWNGQEISGAGIAPGTKIVTRTGQNAYTVSISQTVASTAVNGKNVTYGTVDASYFGAAFPLVTGTSDPDFSKQPKFGQYPLFWDGANNKPFESDLIIYPVVEYNFESSPIIDNNCLGSNKVVNVTYSNAFEIAKNPLLNKMAFWSKFLGYTKKNGYFHSRAFTSSLSYLDTLDNNATSFKYVYNATNDAANDTLKVLEVLLPYGYFKNPGTKGFLNTFLLSSKIVPNAAVTDAKCFGEKAKIEITSTGGFAPITGLVTEEVAAIAGEKTYEVTDANACKVIAKAVIKDAPAKVVASSSVVNAKCFGDKAVVSINATGGTGVITGTGDFNVAAVAGSIKYAVVDANSCKSDSISVTIASAPAVLSATTSSVAANGSAKDGEATVVAAGGTAPYAYTWTGLSETTASITVVKGDYSVVVKDANGCTANASVTVGEKTNSIKDLAITSLAIFPNPVANELNVKFNANSDATIELVNVTGQVIATKNASAFANVTFDTAELNAGVYFVNIKVAEGTFTQKIIKD
jgi:hypothetical protein